MQYLLVLLLVLLQATSGAQRLTRKLTIADGLPSNLIYNILQDQKGFLWVATDNGVTRYDGNNFKVFTTEDGLPDNEVLELRQEPDGTIWVNTFKQGPFYFDENTNRFINPLAGEQYNKNVHQTVLYVRLLKEGGIVFYSGNEELVFKNKKLVQLPYKTAFTYADGKSRAYLCTVYKQSGLKYKHYVVYEQGAKTDSVLLYTSNDKSCLKILMDDKLYVLFRSGSFYVVSYNKHQSKFNIKNIQIPEDIAWFRLTDEWISILSGRGDIYVYDRTKLQLLHHIIDKSFLNCFLKDVEGNIWTGSLNNGIRFYKANDIVLLDDSDDIDHGYLSILAASNGRVYAGNYYGEILDFASQDRRARRPYGGKYQTWVRNLVFCQNKIFTISERAIIADFKRKIYLDKNVLQRIKDATVFNDSIIICGGVDTESGLFKINAKTEEAVRLPGDLMRVSKVKAYQGQYIYCATNQGLYKYDYYKKKVINSFSNTPFKSDRILDIEITPEGLVVVSTSTTGVHILKDDKIINTLNKDALINNAIINMVATPNHSFWLLARNGLSKVSYKLSGSTFSYNIANLPISDGLPDEGLTDIDYRNDSIFLATERGIVYLSEKINIVHHPIKTYLTAIRIGHQSIPLNKNNKYDLSYSQRSLSLEFSGIALDGHLKRLEYTFDGTDVWSPLDANRLNLELNTGKHTLQVRAVDMNIGEKQPVATIVFNVKAPFYRQLWFIILMAGVIAGFTVYIISKVRSVKKQRELNRRLYIEEERNRITADLHDDIGSTLSSLQIYSDIAHELVDKDSQKAKNMLQQISSGVSKVAENIGDIIWSMKTSEVQAFSLEARIKNIVSEFLSPTNIDYELEIDANANEKINCITCRKNMILIVKEAMNNIVKYSNASNVKLSLKQINTGFLLTIKDNGIGMVLDEKINTGNGLANIKMRMAELEGTCNIVSEPYKGTEISCFFPRK